MANGFIHGVEVIEIDAGARPIEGVSASVIGLLGTAYKGPALKPTLITSRTRSAEVFGAGGTIPAAIAAIFDQTTARVVVINAVDPETDKTAVAAAEHQFAAQADGGTLNVGQRRLIASSVVVPNQAGDTTYDVGDDYTFDAETGVFTRVAGGTIADGPTVKIAFDYLDEAKVTDADIVAAAAKLVEAEALTGAAPRIIIAPGYTGHVTRNAPDGPLTGAPVTSGLIAVAERLRAVIVADGPGTTAAEAIAYRKLLSSRRVYLVDPPVQIANAAGSGARGGPDRPQRSRARLLVEPVESADPGARGDLAGSGLHPGRPGLERQPAERRRGGHDRALRRLPAVGQPHDVGRSEVGFPGRGADRRRH